MSSAKTGVLAPGEESGKFLKILWSLVVKEVKLKDLLYQFVIL